ncbi:MAG: hypothetical protein GC134_00400 [Proteobacteria bacterium]|nr:hypothetical protein [Pseudomonadota bacterium]
MPNTHIAERIIVDLMNADHTPIGKTRFSLWKSTLGYHVTNPDGADKPFRRLDDDESETVKDMLAHNILLTSNESCEPTPGVMAIRLHLNINMPLIDIARYLADIAHPATPY